jgi:hypothetical protein
MQQGLYSQANAEHSVPRWTKFLYLLNLGSYSAMYLCVANGKSIAFFMIPYKQNLCNIHTVKHSILHRLVLFKGYLKILTS